MIKGFKFILMLAVVIAVMILPVGASDMPELTVNVNGEDIKFDRPLILENGRILVISGSVFEKLNAKVTSDETNKNKVFIEDEYTTVELVINDKNALVHKKYDFSGIPLKVTLDVMPRFVNGEVYLPLRFVAESLGAQVEWNGKTRTAFISTGSDITPVEAPVEYTLANEADIQSNSELVKWYEDNSKVKGINSLKVGTDTYVLLSAGEKPTGGYGLEIESATAVSPGSLYVTARLIKPEPDEFVIMVLTYPNKLVKIEDRAFDIIDGDIQE